MAKTKRDIENDAFSHEMKILAEARDRLKKAMDDDYENRKLALEDLEFIGIEGAQWPAAIRAEREADGRPCITTNKMPTFIDQVVGDQRMNRPSIKVIPVDDKADVAIAQILGGWIKHVQQISKADTAIDHGFEHAVACGYGAMRVVTEYVSDDSFDQDARIKKIDNALAVFWGKHSEYDCSDAPYCFIITDMDKEEFKETYGHDPMPFSQADSQFVEGWCTASTVRVAEYFTKEPFTKTIYELDDGSIVDKVPGGGRAIKSGESPLYTNKRTVNGYKIKWYLLSGNKIEDEKDWVGKKYIPVIPIWGKELNVGGKRKVRGLIRNAKDPQRMYNYWNRLSLTTPIPTINGWKIMADIHKGDIVFSEKGIPNVVLGESPIFDNCDCYKIMFNDDSFIVADEDHLWAVEEKQIRQRPDYKTIWKQKTVHTKDLLIAKHRINVTKPLELPEKDLKIPPYTLGLWLSDGASHYPTIFAHKNTINELSGYMVADGCKLTEKKPMNDGSIYRRHILGLRKEFVEYNLLKNKHIPTEYLRSSFNQRLSLLQGLMDGDGSCQNGGGVRFTTAIPELAKGFSELIRTLGFKASSYIDSNTRNFYKGEWVKGKTEYHFYFTTYSDTPVFKLKYKLKKQNIPKETNRNQSKRYRIVSIEKVNSVPVKCIAVDSPSNLFLAGEGMIPTHNSCDTETVALAAKTPYIATAKQIAGHELQWNEAHRKNFAVLLVNADEKAPGWPHREPPPQVSTAMVSKIQMADQEIRDTMGLQKASLGMQSNERSGVAIQERKKEGDVGTFAFIDNLARSIEHLGRVLVDVAPGILDTERIIRLGLEGGLQKFEAINIETTPEGPIVKDLSIGTYDVVVTVGPSFTTQRTEARQSMSEFIQYYPDAAPLIGDLYAKSMDWPGADEMAERLEFLLPPEIREKKDREAAENSGGKLPPSLSPSSTTTPPPPPPDPLLEVKLQEAGLKLQELQIKIEQEKVKLQGLQIDNQIKVTAGQKTTTPIPGRAEGGPVREDQPYIVGEKGPEVVVPKQDGVVIPSNPLLRESLYPGEDLYFKANPNVTGMATEDDKVILNPYSTLNDQERESVIRNESARIYMRRGGIVPNFMITPEQRNSFIGTPYEKNEQGMMETIAARILSGDPSALNYTSEQKTFVDSFLNLQGQIGE